MRDIQDTFEIRRRSFISAFSICMTVTLINSSFTEIKINWCQVSRFQKQPFANVLQHRCSSKFLNIYRKTHVLESLFNKVTDLKEKLQQRCFPLNIAKLLRAAFFIEHLWWLHQYCGKKALNLS